MQQALEGLTGVRLADQILISRGVKLDSSRTLGSYAVPDEGPRADHKGRDARENVGDAEDALAPGANLAFGGSASSRDSLHRDEGIIDDSGRRYRSDEAGGGGSLGAAADVAADATGAGPIMKMPRLFLFNRASLRADAPIEEGEALPTIVPVESAGAGAGAGSTTAHPLDTCPNVLLRNLPTYEREFRLHLLASQSLWDASQQRQALASRLLDEMKVQALALEEARANVEVHYRHVSAAHGEFMREFHLHNHAATALLASIPTAVDAAVGFALDPRLAKEGRRTLGDCIDTDRVQEVAATYAGVHDQFKAKVSGLANTYRALQINVEELYMSTPPVDIKEMQGSVNANSAKLVEDEASLLQSLSQDLSKVQAIVEDTVARMGGGTEAATSSMESAGAVCEALEKMNTAHVTSHLPRIESCDNGLHEICVSLSQSKASMTRCVHEQLRSVSSLQSRIRDLKTRHSAFRETMAAHSRQFAELKTVRHTCTAFESCMSELMRRQAFCVGYGARAEHTAEAMAAARQQETERRLQFEKEHCRFLPHDLWEDMGLSAPPPRCEITVSDPRLRSSGDANDMKEPLDVTIEDVKRVHIALAASASRYDLGGLSSLIQKEHTQKHASLDEDSRSAARPERRPSAEDVAGDVLGKGVQRTDGVDAASESLQTGLRLRGVSGDGANASDLGPEQNSGPDDDGLTVGTEHGDTEPVEVMASRLQAEVAIGLANIAVLQAQVQVQPSSKASGSDGSIAASPSSSTTALRLDSALKSQEELCRQLYKTLRERDDTIGELRSRCESLERKLAQMSGVHVDGGDN